jgi:hypothetical protein
LSGLADLQLRFQAGILSHDDDRVLADINHGSRESADVLFGVYRYAYAARLVEVLQANFDVTWSLLGDNAFEEAARAYIAETPSGFRNARWYGDNFAAFLARYFPDSPAVTDIAAMDWAIAAAFDASDQNVVDEGALAAFHPQDWPNLRFELHKSLQLVAVQTSAAENYEALSGGGPPASMEQSIENTVLVWRDGHTVRYRRLDLDESSLLANMIVGCKFSRMCEIAADVVGTEYASTRVAGLLRTWLQGGIVVSVSMTCS